MNRQLLVAAAVVLMVAGVVMIFTSPGPGIGIPVIAVGIALTAIVERDKRRHHA